MLAANEFTVGTLADAKPLSLILPRKKYEATILVGKNQAGHNAVVLSGQYSCYCIDSRNNDNWSGIIIGDIHIELDEKSVFDALDDDPALGNIVRLDSNLTIIAKQEKSYPNVVSVTLCDDLSPVTRLKAGFRRWQIVLGEGVDKRVLWRFPEDSEQKA